MRVHTFYTPYHARLVDEHFRPSAERHFGAANVACHLVEGSDEGDYGSPGFVRYCYDRLQRYADLCEASGEPLLLSDADVRFYGDVPADLEVHARAYAHDAYFQWDGPGGHCMGFVYARVPGAFAGLCRQVQGAMRGHPELEDQQSLRYLVARGQVRASLGVLPSPRYWTYGLGGEHWRPGDPLSPPVETLLMHHGNWTVGLPSKLAMLEAVAALVAARGCPYGGPDTPSSCGLPRGHEGPHQRRRQSTGEGGG